MALRARKRKVSSSALLAPPTAPSSKRARGAAQPMSPSPAGPSAPQGLSHATRAAAATPTAPDRPHQPTTPRTKPDQRSTPRASGLAADLDHLLQMFGQLPTALDLCRARSQRPVLSQVRSTMEMLTRRQCTVDQLLQMKHLMPGIVRVQRLLGPSDELLVSLARPAAAAAASPAAAPGSATKAHQHADLQAAFAAKLLAHQEQRQQQPPPPPQSPLRDATAQHAQGSPRKASPRKAAPAQHSVPLAPISPFRGTPSSAAAAPIAAALGSAATPLPQSRLPFASAKTPASAACRKGSTPRARLSFGLQGPTPELPELPAKGSETELQRRLKRQSSSGLLPISLNVLQEVQRQETVQAALQSEEAVLKRAETRHASLMPRTFDSLRALFGPSGMCTRPLPQVVTALAATRGTSTAAADTEQHLRELCKAIPEYCSIERARQGPGLAVRVSRKADISALRARLQQACA